MRILLLGTGGYHPSEDRHTACIYLPEAGAVLDAGTGFFRVAPRLLDKTGLASAEASLSKGIADRLDPARRPGAPSVGRSLRVFLSHPHLDHAIGLTWFLPALKFGLVDRAQVYGTPSTLEALRNHLFGTAIFSGQARYEFVALPSRVEVGRGGVLTHCELSNHPGGSTGYRLDWPAFSLAYITDTTVDGTYTDFVRGVDLLIHECNFPDHLSDLADQAHHSHATPVAELARSAQVNRLILVHLDPWLPSFYGQILSTARSIFPATELAHDLLEVRFAPK